MGVKKYFIAVVIPEPLFAEIEELKQELFRDHGLKGGLRSPAHITLHRPFEWKEEREQVLVEKLGQFKFESRFEIELCDYSFFEPRVVYVGVVENKMLAELHRQLKFFAGRELGLLNEINDLRGFAPHVTIAFRDLKKPLFYTLKAHFETQKLRGSFPYRGFSILKFDKRWEALCFIPFAA